MSKHYHLRVTENEVLALDALFKQVEALGGGVSAPLTRTRRKVGELRLGVELRRIAQQHQTATAKPGKYRGTVENDEGMLIVDLDATSLRGALAELHEKAKGPWHKLLVERVTE